LRRPGASDSATVEGWRHLGLDIQSVEVLTIEDALSELSRPETVQVSSSLGTLTDGSKQYLIDDLPQILILHLKRFQYDPTLKGVVKQRKIIRFGSDLVIPKSQSYSPYTIIRTDEMKTFAPLRSEVRKYPITSYMLVCR
jgi:ubiquitin carboxyl-terminal hydrolase 10